MHASGDIVRQLQVDYSPHIYYLIDRCSRNYKTD